MKNDFRNWSDVRVFLAVFRNGSTLAASKELGMAQPTVARRIDSLEHRLRLVLFERDTRGFRPTPEAYALFDHAQSIETAVGRFAEEAHKRTSQIVPIRVTAAALNFSTVFGAILAEFTAKYPDVRFEFIGTDRRLDLLAGEADVAIRHSRTFDEGSLICRKLSIGRFALYASRNYVEKNGLPLPEQAFSEHCFIVPEGDHMPDFLRDYMLERIDANRVAMSCGDWPSLVTAVQAGIGIGPVATGLGDTIDELVRCFDLPESLSYQTMLLVSPQAYRRPEVKAFTAFFAPRYAELARAQQDFAG